MSGARLRYRNSVSRARRASASDAAELGAQSASAAVHVDGTEVKRISKATLAVPEAGESKSTAEPMLDLYSQR
jgi:hypothetical protein